MHDYVFIHIIGFNNTFLISFNMFDIIAVALCMQPTDGDSLFLMNDPGILDTK